MPIYYNIHDLQFLSKVEIEKLFDSITKLRDKTMFSLMYYHGLRVSEVVRLKVSDIDLNAGTIYIEASKKGKSGKECTHPKALELLKLYQPKTKFLFPSQKSEQITTCQVFRLFQKYTRAVGLPPEKQHPHCLRHSLAVNYARAGLTAEQVQIFLRHQNIVNTMKYYKILPDQKIELQRRAFQFV